MAAIRKASFPRFAVSALRRFSHNAARDQAVDRLVCMNPITAAKEDIARFTTL